MRILIADDDPIQRDRVAAALGEWGHQAVCAENGERAWRMLEDDPEIAILLTDWIMPGLDGVELCRRLRSAQRPRYLPIILLTSRDRSEDLVEALTAGADAFLTKPFDPQQLLAQLHVAERILQLEERLERQLRELRLAHERLEVDLSAAAEVQSSLLPEASPKIHGVSFAWVYEACDKLGGDMFNVFRLDERRVGMYVLDVSGHGTPAALQSVSLSHALTPYDQQGGILKRVHGDERRYAVVAPSRVARELNRHFQLLERSGQFFTFLYGVLDVETRVVRYVRAGHPGPIVASGAGARSLEKGGGIPIGITPDAAYEDEELELAPGDSLVFYTDGLIETLSREGEAFGLERTLQALATGGSGVRERLGVLQHCLAQFGGGKPRRDDVTIVALEVA